MISQEIRDKIVELRTMCHAAGVNLVLAAVHYDSGADFVTVHSISDNNEAPPEHGYLDLVREILIEYPPCVEQIHRNMQNEIAAWSNQHHHDQLIFRDGKWVWEEGD